MELLHQLVFDDQGLIPAIVQDYFSGEVQAYVMVLVRFPQNFFG